MMDLISREEAIEVLSLGKEILSRVLDDMDVVGVYREKYSYGLELTESYINDIEELQPAQPEPQWIPCSERLPEDGKRVLATHLGGLNPDRQVIEHVYANGKFTMGWDMDMNMDSPTFGQRYMGEVIAWMPLPEPYRGGEQE